MSATTINPSQLEQLQGQTAADQNFGYVHGNGGGWFFTWRPTLDETLSSVERDAEAGGGGLLCDDVVSFLRDYLPTTKRGKDSWGLWEAEDAEPIGVPEYTGPEKVTVNADKLVEAIGADNAPRK